MKDKFSGQVVLSRLFDPSVAQALIHSLILRGASTAQDRSATCAVLGTPHFEDAEPARIALESGIAAGLLIAWNQNGVNVTSRIRGAYSIAIVDVVKRSVFLAVDRFAIETLCYCIEGDMLSFSDRADCVEGRGDELDPQAIFDYLYFHMVPAPRTIFSKVRRLPAAHSLLSSENDVQEIRHWPLRFDEHHHEPF